MKINNRFIYGIVSIALALILAFVAIPTVTKKREIQKKSFGS